MVLWMLIVLLKKNSLLFTWVEKCCATQIDVDEIQS
jgi:hypothetical protein